MAFDIGEMFRRIFTPAGTGGLEASTQMGLALARQQADAALGAQRDATAAIAAAAIPPADSEEIRVASEDRLRRLVTRGSFMDNFFGGPGAAGKPGGATPLTPASPLAPQPVNLAQLLRGGA